jgi:hypothetical protein
MTEMTSTRLVFFWFGGFLVGFGVHGLVRELLMQRRLRMCLRDAIEGFDRSVKTLHARGRE